MLAAEAAAIMLADPQGVLRMAASTSEDAKFVELLKLQERAIRRGEVVNEQLQAALTSRVIIEQAKGVLAQETGLSVTAAFDLLRGHARATNQRLTEVARRIVERELPAGALRPGRRP